MEVPFFDLRKQNSLINSEIFEALKEVNDSNNFILGPRLEKFEKEFASYCGSKFSLGVGNGLDALTLALRAADIGPGDLVIVPAHTFIASALAVISAGAEPYLLDIDPATYTLDSEKLSAIDDKKVKAVMPVHLYGQPAAMDKINAVAKSRSWLVIEDNAQAQGAKFQGTMTGNLGDIAGTSFYPSKNLGALGDGGAVTTSTVALYERVASLRNYGQREKYVHVSEGVNSRLDEIQAAVLSVKLRQLDIWNSERIAIADKYIKRLEGVGDLRLPRRAADRTHVYHLFVVSTSRRDACVKHLQSHGVAAMIHYPTPIHQHQAFARLQWAARTDLKHSEESCRTVLSLPLYPGMPDEHIEFVCKTLVDFFR